MAADEKGKGARGEDRDLDSGSYNKNSVFGASVLTCLSL